MLVSNLEFRASNLETPHTPPYDRLFLTYICDPKSVHSLMLSIQTTHLTKSFESLTAVKDLNLEVKTGEIFGLVGPDASGKTTTLRMLCGILPPDGGEATVAGCDIRKETDSLKEDRIPSPAIWALRGSHRSRKHPFLRRSLSSPEAKKKGTGREAPSICQSGALWETKGSGPFGRDEAEAGTDLCVDPYASTPFLDEPTTGVDPLSRRDFWIILYDLLKEGVTILFSTSYLDEAERCSRVGLIYEGDLLIADTPSLQRRESEGRS